VRAVRLYWAVVGALIGFGVLALLSIGFPFLLLGLVLVLVGWRKFGWNEAWAVLFFGGLIDAGVVAYVILTSAPPCPAVHVGTTQAACADMPTNTYWQIVVGALCLALVGASVPFVTWLRPRDHLHWRRNPRLGG
jgi:hypothetical protein